MIGSNVARVLGRIAPDDRVLDVGGWFRPFTRADAVVDLMPYATRGGGGREGPEPERFTEETWTQMDFGGGATLPFGDDQFDFVICSHTLEDIRDPVGLCAELSRVGRAGYVETPSLLAELTFGIESRKYAGWYHHRWLVQMGGGAIRFRHKPHLVHGDWRYHLPKRIARELTPEQRVTSMIWDGHLQAEEVVELDMVRVQRQVAATVRATGAYPGWRYATVPAIDAARRARDRVGRASRRGFGAILGRC